MGSAPIKLLGKNAQTVPTTESVVDRIMIDVAMNLSRA